MILRENIYVCVARVVLGLPLALYAKMTCYCHSHRIGSRDPAVLVLVGFNGERDRGKPRACLPGIDELNRPGFAV